MSVEVRSCDGHPGSQFGDPGSAQTTIVVQSTQVLNDPLGWLGQGVVADGEPASLVPPLLLGSGRRGEMLVDFCRADVSGGETFDEFAVVGGAVFISAWSSARRSCIAAGDIVGRMGCGSCWRSVSQTRARRVRSITSCQRSDASGSGGCGPSPGVASSISWTARSRAIRATASYHTAAPGPSLGRWPSQCVSQPGGSTARKPTVTFAGPSPRHPVPAQDLAAQGSRWSRSRGVRGQWRA